MGLLFPAAYQFLNSNARAVASGTVTFYDTGTTNLRAIYSDPDLTISAANPYSLDASGRLAVNLYGTGDYTVVVKTSAGATVWSRDEVFGWDKTYPVPSTASTAEANLAATGVVYYPAGDYANSALDIDRDALVYGDGALSTMDEGVVVDSATTGDFDLEVRDLAGTATGAFVSAEQAGEANLQVRIKDLSLSAAGSAVALRNTGTIRGTISGIVADDLTSLGINVGWNDYTASLEWGPVLLRDSIIDSIHPADTNSHYGILSYAPYSIITGNFVRDIGSSTGADCEGIYTKARHSVIANNILVDGGEGEAYINIKGDKRGESSDPLGYGVVATGNVLLTTAASAAADASQAGVKIANDDVLVSSHLIENLPSSAITTLSAELDNATIADVLVVGGAASDGAIYIPANGKVHTIRGATIRGVTGNAIRLQGQSSASEIDLSDINVDGTGGFGLLLRPTADSVAEYRIANARFRNVSGAAVIKLESNDPKHVSLVSVDCGSHATKLGYEAGVGPESWHVRNLHGTLATTDATETLAFRIRIPTGKPALITATFVATDGTDTFALTKKAAYFNAAGTVSLIGSASDLFAAESAGASAWDGQFDISGNDVLVQVTGEAAHNISWKVSVDVDTP